MFYAGLYSAHHFRATNPRTQPPVFRAKPVKDIGQYSPL